MKRRMVLLVVLAMSILFTAAVSAEGGSYAVDYVVDGTYWMSLPENALGAPDGVFATSASGGRIMLDMGAEVTGPLIIYSSANSSPMLDLATSLESSQEGYTVSYFPSTDGALVTPSGSFRYLALRDSYTDSTGWNLDAVYAGPVLTFSDATASVKPGRTNTYTVLLTITDGRGNPVTKAVVTADWETPTGNVSATATTRRGGVAKFTFRGEAWQLRFTGVTHASIPYARDVYADGYIALP